MRAIRNQIYIGSLDNPTYYFENDQIIVSPASQTVALVGEELCIDVFTPLVSDSEENLNDVYHFRSSDGDEIQAGAGEVYAISIEENTAQSELINLPYGTPVWYYHSSKLVGKFYINLVKREAKNKFRLDCVSAIGLLDKKMHGGGLFTGTTFGVVLAHILAEGLHGDGNPVIEYEIDDDVADLPVSGWLPYASKRNNLYQLIFANGVNIIKNWDGNPRFTFLYTAPTTNPATVETENIYYGGSVEYTKPYSKVSIAEHTYVANTNAEAETLFDNTSGSTVSNEEIWFENAPIIVSSLTADGTLSVVSATENSAVISGKGTLTGIPYTHSVRMVRRTNTLAPEEKTATVDDCTMVNVINSENLLNRLYAFYCPPDNIKKISNAFVYTDERCGKAYQIKNPYGETETAFLANMGISASAVNKADSEWYVGYEPAGQQGLYQHVDIIVPEWDEENQQWILEGDWEVPEDVTEFKAVLIGGGTGGQSGWAGYNGSDAMTYEDVEQTADISASWYGAEGGDGGNGGNGGTAGRAKTVIITGATSGDTWHYVLGQGGEGGAATGFRPDTTDELRAALENEHPETTYTDAQINALIAQEDSDWNGSPNAGTAGTATTFSDGTTTHSTADSGATVPSGGIYDPISDQFFALHGASGIKGGKGGARTVQKGNTFNWVTDGESVQDNNGTVYNGGTTGRPMTTISGLSEARFTAYGGNGAGAAIGIDRGTSTHMNGGSDQSAFWVVTEDE